MVLTRADIRKDDRYVEALLKKCYQDEDVHFYMREMSCSCDHEFGDDGYSPIHLAVVLGEVELLNALLKKDVDKERVDARKRTPLLLAVSYGRLPILEALLAAGANAHATDYCRPYYTEAGANVDLVGNFFIHRGLTPLHVIASVCRQVRVVRTLVRHGANPNIRNGKGFSALLLAARARVGDDIFLDADMAVLEELIAHGADVSASEDTGGRTALHFAARREFSGGIRVLVGAGAYVNARDKRGRTPLHVAAKMAGSVPSLVCVKLLLRWGGDESVTDNNGIAPSDVIGQNTLSTIDEYTDAYCELTRKLLANAPAERAWHRRGVLLLCRAFPERVPLMRSQHHARTGVARRTRSQATRGFHQVLAALVNLTDECIFRTIVCFI